MNITVDEFLLGLERSVSELPDVLAEWPTLDSDLCESYSDQLAWTLSVLPDVSSRGGVDVAERLARATAALVEMSGAIEASMGLSMAFVLSADIKQERASQRLRPPMVEFATWAMAA